MLRSRRILASFWAVALGAVAATAAAELDSRPHPTREGRWVAQVGEWQVEYSPGQDAYVRPLVEAAVAAQPERISQTEAVVPLSPRDLRLRRGEILQRIAREIGLQQPSELQGACYDTFLNYYELMVATFQAAQLLQERLADCRRLALWDRAEVVERLQRGEAVEGFTYDAATNALTFGFKWSSGSAEGDAGAAKPAAAEAPPGLEHRFNYDVTDGVASLSAGFKYVLGQRAAAPPALEMHERLAAMRAELGQREIVLPVKMSSDDGTLLSPAAAAEEFGRFQRNLTESVAAVHRERDGPLALLVLHETAELGLVEHYLGSRDRRWMCDGTANWVAWRVAQAEAGAEFAREVYDLEAQLTRAAPWQNKIRLTRWPAVERQSKQEQGSELDQAHYAFATRAIALLAERHGPELVARLWQEIGRTPRRKASLKTVQRAYAQLTGERLDDVVRLAERTPVAAPRALAAAAP